MLKLENDEKVEAKRSKFGKKRKDSEKKMQKKK